MYFVHAIVIHFLDSLITLKLLYISDLSKDPIARKMRLRRGRRDQEEADQDQAKILKVSLYILLRYQPYLCCWYYSPTSIDYESQSDILFYFIYFLPCWEYRTSCVQGCLRLTWERTL